MTALLDAGMEALGEKGYHTARVDDVVRMFLTHCSHEEDL